MNAGATRELGLREAGGKSELTKTRAELLAIDRDVVLPVPHARGRAHRCGRELADDAALQKKRGFGCGRINRDARDIGSVVRRVDWPATKRGIAVAEHSQHVVTARRHRDELEAKVAPTIGPSRNRGCDLCNISVFTRDQAVTELGDDIFERLAITIDVRDR